ncbi:MAG: hypothetical protein HDR88_05075 [Bacteroides sp.]|nr:hypothetical protein [Bacteroides sp.]
MNRFFTICVGIAMTTGFSAYAGHAPQATQEGRAAIAQLKSVTPGSVTMPEMKGTNGQRFHMGSPMRFQNVERNAARVTANGGDIYGWTRQGGQLYEFTADGIELTWADPTTDPVMSYTFLFDGKLCGPALVTNGMGIYGGYWREYDFKTGEVLVNEEWNLYEDPIYEQVAYNPSDGYVYAVTQWIPYGQGVFLAKASPYDMKHPTIICQLQAGVNIPTGMCYNGVADALYGFMPNGNLVSIASDGTMTKVCSVDISSEYDWIQSWVTACAYSPKDNLIYFTPMSWDSTALATINPETGEANVYAKTPNNNQFYSLVTTDEAYKDVMIPERPDFIEAVFDGGSTSGYNVYKMPSYLVNGDPITTELTVNVGVDDAPYSTLTAKAGEEIEVKYDNLSTGVHLFNLSVSVEGHQSRPVVTRKYIGYDVPNAPTNVELTSEMVKWSAVTLGVEKGYIPAEDIVYEVSLNGEKLGDTKETSFALDLPTDTEIALYVAEVVATYVNPVTGETEKSVAGVSNDMGYGNPYSIPFTVKPTADQAKLCKIIDNGDDATWEYAGDEDAFRMAIFYQDWGENNDWLILPPFEVTDASKIYTLMFEVANWSANYTHELIEVFIGKEPTVEGMTTRLTEEFSPAKSRPLYELVNLPLNLDEGVYYLGFHVISPTSELGVYLRNISVEYTGLSDESPAMVTEWTAEPGAEGALNATFTVTLPTENLGGNAMDTNSVITATFIGESTAEVSGKPGEKVTATVNTLQGDNQITFYTSCNGHESLRQSLDVYTGQHIPAAPENVVVEGFQDLKGAYLKWDPVTKGQDDTYVNPADVSYSVYVMSQYAWDIFETTDTEYTYECPADRPVHQATVGVMSQNFVGSNYQLQAGYVYMGTPYTLPIAENFEEAAGGMNLSPWITYLPVDSEVVEFGINYLDRLGDFEFDDADIVMYMTGNPGASGMVGTPFFSTEGMKSVTLLMTLNTGVDFPGLTIYGSDNNLDNMVEVGYVPANPNGEEFTEVSIELPESLLDLPVVTLYLSTEIEEEGQIMILARLELDGSTTSTGIENVLSGRTIFGGKGEVILNGFAGEEVSIFNLDGTKVMSGNVKGDHTTYPLTKGLYIVQVADRKVKAVVR